MVASLATIRAAAASRPAATGPVPEILEKSTPSTLVVGTTDCAGTPKLRRAAFRPPANNSKLITAFQKPQVCGSSFPPANVGESRARAINHRITVVKENGLCKWQLFRNTLNFARSLSQKDHKGQRRTSTALRNRGADHLSMGSTVPTNLYPSMLFLPHKPKQARPLGGPAGLLQFRHPQGRVDMVKALLLVQTHKDGMRIRVERVLKSGALRPRRAPCIHGGVRCCSHC